MEIKFIVNYIDDFKKPHITFAKDMAEVNFIRDRFQKVTFEAVKMFIKY